MKRLFYLFYTLLLIVTLLFCVLPVSAGQELGIGDEVDINGIKAKIVDIKDGQLVYEAVIYPNIYSSSSDGLAGYNTSSDYNTTRTSVNAVYLAYSSTSSICGNNLNESGNYGIYRTFLYFNTSALSGYTMTAGSINLYVWEVKDTNNESVQIQSGMATYPHDPLVVGDFDLTNYAGDGGSKDITTFSVGSYNAITLNATGYGWVNTSGWTKYCLRTTGDINNNTPTGQNHVYFRMVEYGSNMPYLSVTFTALNPAVISVAASNIATTTARLNSDITEDGGDTDCDIRFGYGTTSQIAANFLLYDTVTAWVSGYDENDLPYLDVASLVDTTTYFYRVQVRNETATVTSATEQTFDTLASIDDMITFIGFPDDDNISLSWVKADGATNTLIRYRTDTYPTTTADGTLVYNGTGVSYIHSSLSEGTTYYYSAWGESGGVYSTNEINLVMTTTGIIGDYHFPVASPPSGWVEDPNETFLANLQPFYSIINGLADTWQMPRGNMWLFLALILDMLIGIGLYVAFKAPALSLLVMALVILFFIMLHILSWYFIVLVVFLGLGGWSTRPQGI